MSTQSLDPRTALVALRIADLRREASAAAAARRVSARRTAVRSRPETVVAGLRDAFLRARARARDTAARDTAACATC